MLISKIEEVHTFAAQCRILKLCVMISAMHMTSVKVICGQNGKRINNYEIDLVLQLDICEIRYGGILPVLSI
jgi:hypothetical protein